MQSEQTDTRLENLVFKVFMPITGCIDTVNLPGQKLSQPSTVILKRLRSLFEHLQVCVVLPLGKRRGAARRFNCVWSLLQGNLVSFYLIAKAQAPIVA